MASNNLYAKFRAAGFASAVIAGAILPAFGVTPATAEEVKLADASAQPTAHECVKPKGNSVNEVAKLGQCVYDGLKREMKQDQADSARLKKETAALKADTARLNAVAEKAKREIAQSDQQIAQADEAIGCVDNVQAGIAAGKLDRNKILKLISPLKPSEYGICKIWAARASLAPTAAQ